MEILNTTENLVLDAKILKKKNNLELALENLDLQGTLALMHILSERSLYLISKDILKDKNTNVLKVKH